jgi:inhibitor of nuclear factor kappa-B kinase subunit alpha
MSKNQRILDLHNAHVHPRLIREQLDVSIRTVYRVIREGRVDRKKRETPSHQILTKKFLAKLSKAVEKEPTLSIRRHAKKLKVSATTVRNGLKKVGKQSVVRPPVPLLTERLKELRLERSKRLLSWLKKHDSATVKIFSDKKVFTVDQAYNRRNDRYIVDRGTPAVPVNKTKHPASVMVLGVICSDGRKPPPIFIPEGLKVNTEAYLNLLETELLPWLKKTYPEGNYVFQQDGAPCHTSQRTQEWLGKNFANFWPKDFWPPSSPDLNPLDYSIWGVVEAKACRTSHASVAALKCSISKVWKAMTRDYLIKTCRAFRTRLETVVERDGDLFEKN